MIEDKSWHCAVVVNSSLILQRMLRIAAKETNFPVASILHSTLALQYQDCTTHRVMVYLRMYNMMC